MQQILLSCKEFVLLASQLGANNIPGLNDPFFECTKEQISSQIPKLRLDIEKKKMATLDFEGSFKLKSEIRNIILTCIRAEKYIIRESNIADEFPNKSIIYSRSNKIVMLSFIDAHLIQLKEISIQSIGDAFVANNLEPKKMEDCDFSFRILSDVFESINTDNEQETFNALLNLNFSHQMANLLTMAMFKKNEYITLLYADIKTNKSKNYSCIFSHIGVLEIHTTQLDGDEFYEFFWKSNHEIIDEIISFVQYRGEK